MQNTQLEITPERDVLKGASDFIQTANLEEFNEFLDEVFNAWLYNGISGEIDDYARGSYYYFLRQIKALLLKIDAHKDTLTKLDV